MDLKLFCGTDPFRDYLHQPFSFDDFTYATNGHIIVRVPRRSDVPDQKKVGKWDAPFLHLPKTTFAPLNHRALPKLEGAREDRCPSCDGHGRGHNCPDCECTCEDCGGSGKMMLTNKVSTTVRGHSYDLRYIEMVLSLPGVEIATSKQGEDEPLLFRFDGGVGSLMPIRGHFKEHVEIEVSAVA